MSSRENPSCLRNETSHSIRGWLYGGRRITCFKHSAESCTAIFGEYAERIYRTHKESK